MIKVLFVCHGNIFSRILKILRTPRKITEGGKNLIKEFLHNLPKEVQLEGYRIRHNIIITDLKPLLCLIPDS